MENEINIKKLFYLIRKRVWIIILFTIIFTSIGWIYSVFINKPVYESSSRIIVNADPELMNTLMVMIKEPSFLEYVVKEMELDKSPEELSQRISAGSIGGSAIVKISVIDSNPQLASKIADTTAIVFKEEMPNLLGFNDTKILAKSKINPNPINDNFLRYILIGFLVGLILGVVLIFLLDYLDDTIKSERSSEQLLGVPVLGSVSKINKKNTSLKKNERLIGEVRGESLGTNK